MVLDQNFGGYNGRFLMPLLIFSSVFKARIIEMSERQHINSKRFYN